MELLYFQRDPAKRLAGACQKSGSGLPKSDASEVLLGFSESAGTVAAPKRENLHGRASTIPDLPTHVELMLDPPRVGIGQLPEVLLLASR